MKKISSLLIALCALLIPTGVKAVETAGQALDKCIANVNSAPSLQVDAVIVSSDGKSMQCEMILEREKFTMTTPEMIVWYDGETQWTYSTKSKELSITEPFEEELLQTNPFAILENYAQSYDCRRLSDKELKIELVAKSNSSDVSKAVVTLAQKTYMPTRMDVVLRNGNSFCVVISSTKTGVKLPSTTFQFNSDKYKPSEINDLR